MEKKDIPTEKLIQFLPIIYNRRDIKKTLQEKFNVNDKTINTRTQRVLDSLRIRKSAVRVGVCPVSRYNSPLRHFILTSVKSDNEIKIYDKRKLNEFIKLLKEYGLFNEFNKCKQEFGEIKAVYHFYDKLFAINIKNEMIDSRLEKLGHEHRFDLSEVLMQKGISCRGEEDKII
jgi:hypothetical protein